MRGLADSAYNGEKCLQTAIRHGAMPMHGLKRNTRFFFRPQTQYPKMAHFAKHWPNRYEEMYGKRNHAETAFSMIIRLFGYRVRSDLGLDEKTRFRRSCRCSIYFHWLGRVRTHGFSFATQSSIYPQASSLLMFPLFFYIYFNVIKKNTSISWIIIGILMIIFFIFIYPSPMIVLIICLLSQGILQIDFF